MGDLLLWSGRFLLLGLLFAFIARIARLAGRGITPAYTGTGSGRGHRVDDSILVGSAPCAGVVVSDPEVIPIHARIERRGGCYWLAPLADAGCTWVNDQVVNGEVCLRSGDSIQLGGSRFVFDRRDRL